MPNVIFEEKSFNVCTLSNSRKGKAENTFYQCEYINNEKLLVSYYDMWEFPWIALKSLKIYSE